MPNYSVDNGRIVRDSIGRTIGKADYDGQVRDGSHDKGHIDSNGRYHDEYGRDMGWASNKGSSGDGDGFAGGLIVLVIIGIVAGVKWLISKHKENTTSKQTATPDSRLPALADQTPENFSQETPLIPKASLVVLSGLSAGKVFQVISENFSIGRHSTCNLCLTEVVVSRLHARLRYAQGAWYIQDQESKSCTSVNGKRVGATCLKPGDKIAIGSTTLEFQAG
jgi:hypothetical protein